MAVKNADVVFTPGDDNHAQVERLGVAPSTTSRYGATHTAGRAGSLCVSERRHEAGEAAFDIRSGVFCSERPPGFPNPREATCVQPYALCALICVHAPGGEFTFPNTSSKIQRVQGKAGKRSQRAGGWSG